MVNVFGGSSHRVHGIRGPPGPPGPQGPRGSGKRGPIGPAGPPGKIGKIGPRGEDGPRGEQGVPGARGEVGPPGRVGSPGPAGPPGADGREGPRGSDGSRGERGEAGPPRERGADGREGPRGERGEVGPQGARGMDGKAGPPGKRGEAGPPGQRGADGKEGPRGSDGSRGERGEAGPPGVRGADGKEGARGPRGERGLPGPSSSLEEMCKWMPNLILNNLQTHEEQCCLFIEDLDKDIERSPDGFYIRKWISRTGRGTALSPGMRASSDLVVAPKGRHALSFHRKKTEYIIYDLPLLYHDKTSFGYICVTFRTSSAVDQALLTNYRDESSHFVEIYVTDQLIGIKMKKQGSTEVFHYPIQHHNVDWTTFYLEYKRGANTGRTAFTYYINNSEVADGEFSAEYDTDPVDFLLGGRFDETHWFTGEILSLETYHRWNNKDNEPRFIPACLRQLIRENQYVYKWK